MSKYTRREFLITAGKAGALVALAGCGVGNKAAEPNRRRSEPGEAADKTLAIATGKDPAALVAAAVGALGGISAFVKKGDRVVIKPNASWARSPENAATTNPQVAAAIVKLCKQAGAADVLVVDHLIDRPQELVLAITQIGPVCRAAGARVVAAGNQAMYRRITVPDASLLGEVLVIKEVLAADVFINVPIAKCHSDTTVTLGLKNLMGVVWNRQTWHTSESVHRCIAEFGRAVRPDLTILDANRILLTDGPKGPGKTKDVGQVIAGRDPAAVDAYGASLFGLKPDAVEHIRLAGEYRLGETDLSKVKILKVQR